MNILLDECVPRPLRKLLTNHICRTAQEMGWKSVKNGELLTLAEAQFDLFITSDQGLAYQENLRGRRIAILELSTNKLRPIEAAAAQLRDAASLGETGRAPRAFLRPLGSGGRRSGCSGKNHCCRDCHHRQRRACYRSYPFSTTADNASKTRITTESGSSCARTNC